MKISHHLYVGALGGLAIYSFSKSLPITAAYFFANSAIDIDHIFDFFRDYGFIWNWKKFYRVCCRAEMIHYVVFFHSFELLILVAFLLYLFRDTFAHPYILGVFLGFSTHLISDIIYNRGLRLKYYFIAIRSLRGFKLDEIADPATLTKVRVHK